MNNLYIIGAAGLVIGYLAYIGFKSLITGTQQSDIERMKKRLEPEVSDDVYTQFQQFDEWEQSTILVVSDSVNEFERVVRMWRPDSSESV